MTDVVGRVRIGKVACPQLTIPGILCMIVWYHFPIKNAVFGVGRWQPRSLVTFCWIYSYSL
eukprot:scaffold14974_cov195-Amphora_coffeaeformis.AAC.13